MWLYIVLLLILIYGIRRYQSLFKNYKNVDEMFPGPPTLPILGSVVWFYGDSHQLYKSQLLLGTLYRRSLRVWIAQLLSIVLQQPSEVECLVNNMTYHKKSVQYESLVPWIGRGLLISHGEKWKKNRKALTHAFHFKILESFMEIFHENSNNFCEIIKEKADSTNFDVFNIVKLMALDNICETAMGVSITAMKFPECDYVTSVKRMCHVAYLKIMRPWLQVDLIFKMTREWKNFNEALTYLHGFTRKVIQARIEDRKEAVGKNMEETDDMGIKKRQVFLDILLDAYEQGELTLSEVQEEVDTFMFEGHDTVTSNISFVLYNLAEHPECQEKAYAEQLEIFGDDTRIPTSEDLNRMKYLEMVIKETLRLYPSVPFFGRAVETSLPLGRGAVIPPGCQAFVSLVALHRQPEHWERPEEFYPEHFLPEVSAKRHPYAFIPFSAGPRNCIGMKFAMIELKITLSNVIRKFKLLAANPKVPLKLSIEVILQSQTGVVIAAKERGDKAQIQPKDAGTKTSD